MIGLGKWNLNVAIPLVKVNPILIIGEKDGQYEFTVDVGGFGMTPAVNVFDIREEGNSIYFKHSVPMISQGEFEGMLTFDGIYCHGTVEIPMVGKMSISGQKAEG